MRDRARDILQANDLLTMARTDVVSFYEHVDTEVLSMDLEAAQVETGIIERIHGFLSAFQQQSHAYGLPQGSDASGILANLYLLPVDRFIDRSSVLHVRYSDDMYLFGTSYDALRSTLLRANRALRARRLTISGAKTELFSRDKALEFLDDAERNSIAYFVRMRKSIARRLLGEMFLDATSMGSRDERNIKFSLPRLGRLQDDIALDWALLHLYKYHHLSDQILRYAEKIRRRRKAFIYSLESVAKEIATPDYPYLERNLFQSSLRAGVDSPVIKEMAWRVLRDRNRDNYPREFAARYIGHFGGAADGQLMKMEYESEPSWSVRRAILIAMYELHYMPRKLLEELSRSVLEIRWTAHYLLSNPLLPSPS